MLEYISLFTTALFVFHIVTVTECIHKFESIYSKTLDEIDVNANENKNLVHNVNKRSQYPNSEENFQFGLYRNLPVLQSFDKSGKTKKILPVKYLIIPSNEPIYYSQNGQKRLIPVQAVVDSNVEQKITNNGQKSESDEQLLQKILNYRPTKKIDLRFTEEPDEQLMQKILKFKPTKIIDVKIPKNPWYSSRIDTNEGEYPHTGIKFKPLTDLSDDKNTGVELRNFELPPLENFNGIMNYLWSFFSYLFPIVSKTIGSGPTWLSRTIVGNEEEESATEKPSVPLQQYTLCNFLEEPKKKLNKLIFNTQELFNSLFNETEERSSDVKPRGSFFKSFSMMFTIAKEVFIIYNDIVAFVNAICTEIVRFIAFLIIKIVNMINRIPTM